MSNERFTEKKGKEDAGISSLETSGRPDIEGLSEEAGGRLSGKNLGWSRGKAKAGIDALDNTRSVDIDRHSITGESILLLLLLFFFLSLSHEAFFYSSFFLRVMFLFGEPKRSSTAAVAPKTNATLSLPSLWLRLNFSLHDRSTRR